MKDCLLNFTFEELTNLIVSLGEKKFRAEQIFTNLYSGKQISDITSISKEFRTRLENDYYGQALSIYKSIKSVDGTEKFLYLLNDGNLIEGVVMHYDYGSTLCVSTQVGCRMGCAFCASGIDGLVRNLTPAEILGQIIAVNSYLGGGLKDKRKITNVVLMGSGEPLDNYDNTVKFLRLLSSDKGINISLRNVSLSTCGIVPRIYQLADLGFGINLTISLHSPFDEDRQKIMPIAKKYSIKEILDACAYYFEKTGRRYIFEYVLISGETDGEKYANGLIKLLKGKPCHINLIRLNEVKEKDKLTVTEKKAYQFLGMLEKGGLSATLRARKGADIDGACGQLRRNFIKDNI